MKILQVNNVYAEKSTGKITQSLHEGLLTAGCEAVVVYGRGKGAKGPGVIRLCPDWYGKFNSFLARITGIPYGGCLFSTGRLIRILRREKPDVVHLQCINGNFVNIYRLIGWLKKHKIPTVVSLHAEFMYTGNCGHAFDCDQWKRGCQQCPNGKKTNKSWFFDRTTASWKKMRDAFAGFEDNCIICPVSPWTESRARESVILGKLPFQTVFNGLDAQTFSFCPEQKKENMVLNVTAHFQNEPNHAKGGWYLACLAQRMPDVTFYVAGHAEESDNLPENLQLLGVVRDQKKLAELYRRAKVSVLVSQRETFSMPCAESLCCGTPVVGFRAGAPEQISLPQYSDFVALGDISGLESQLRKWLEADVDGEAVAECAKSAYSAEAMIRKFLDIYRREIWN